MRSTTEAEQQWQDIAAKMKAEWEQLRPRHERICELAYSLWKSTPKNGCAGKIGATLADMGIRKGTFYGWVKEHSILICEADDDEVTEDPGPVADGGLTVVGIGDPEDHGDWDHGDGDRGDEEPVQGKSTGRGRGRGAKQPIKPSTRKAYTLSFEGTRLRKFQKALYELRLFHPWGTDQEAIFNCVMQVAERLRLPHGDREGTGEAA